MTTRIPVQRNGSLISPRLYWRLYTLSPVLMFVGAMSGGVLIVRAVTVLALDSQEDTFSIDIPIAAIVVVHWACGVGLLASPPRAVLAEGGGRLQAPRLLVWQFARRFKVLTMLGAPIVGAVVLLLPTLALITFQAGDGILTSILVSVGFISIPPIWMVLRTPLLGVELTLTHLIARGYFRSRRHSRAEIVSCVVAELPVWLGVLAGVVTRSSVEYAPRLTLADRTQKILVASNSHEADVRKGVDTVNAWLTAGR